MYVCIYITIGPVGSEFTNDPGDLGSIPGHIIQKTFKMVLDTSLLNTQQYKVRIKGKVEQSRKGVAPSPYTSVLSLLKREPSGRSRLRSSTLVTIYIYIYIRGGDGTSATRSRHDQ